DARHKSMVQQLVVRATPNTEGAPQRLTFPVIEDQPAGLDSLKLAATSDAGAPVSYYVVEGPAEIEGDTLRFTAIPPRTKYPVKLTVVAWQFGRPVEPRLMTAEPVERSLPLLAPPTVR